MKSTETFSWVYDCHQFGCCFVIAIRLCGHLIGPSFWRYGDRHDTTYNCFAFVQVFCSQFDGSSHFRYFNLFDNMLFAQQQPFPTFFQPNWYRGMFQISIWSTNYYFEQRYWPVSAQDSETGPIAGVPLVKNSHDWRFDQSDFHTSLRIFSLLAHRWYLSGLPNCTCSLRRSVMSYTLSNFARRSAV